MKRAILSLFLLALAACDSGKELVPNLDSQQSVEVVVALNRAGILAERTQSASGRAVLYSVSVQKTDYARALEILLEYELPREKSNELQNLLGSSSLMSSELNAIKINRALSLEIERMLVDLPGVVAVKALVNSASQAKSLFEQKSQPTASVLIKYFSDQPSKIPFEKETVLEVILKSVPSIDPAGISLNLVKVEPPTSWLNSDNFSRRLRYVRPFTFRVPQEDLKEAKQQLIFVLLAICLAGIVLGLAGVLIWVGRYKAYNTDVSVLIESVEANDLPIEQ